MYENYLDPISKHREVLTPGYLPDHLPNRMEEIKIIETMVKAAFQNGVVSKETIEFLAEFTAERKGDVRIARETLLRAGDLAKKLKSGKIEIKHIKKR